MSQECFVYYRLPGDCCYTEIRQQDPPMALPTVEQLDGRQGFVMAPFAPDEECPVLLFSSAGWRRWPLPEPVSDVEAAVPNPIALAATDNTGRK